MEKVWPTLLATLAALALGVYVGRTGTGNAEARYQIVSQGAQAYRLDQTTGDVVWIVGAAAQPVGKAPKPPVTDPRGPHPTIRAIELVKGAQGVFTGQYGTTEETIKTNLRRLRGPVTVEGWKAKTLNEQNYLVTYSYQHQGSTYSWQFAANLEIGSVQLVNDQDLEAYRRPPADPDINEALKLLGLPPSGTK